MQFKIPQDVQREDQIIWFLTLKQIIICAIGGGISYGVYTSLSKVYILSIALIPTVILGLITLAFAFLSIRGIPFYKVVLLFTEYLFLVPRKRIWKKGSGDAFISMTYVKAKSTEEIKKEKQIEDEMERKKKIKNIIEIMSTQSPHSKQQ